VRGGKGKGGGGREKEEGEREGRIPKIGLRTRGARNHSQNVTPLTSWLGLHERDFQHQPPEHRKTQTVACCLQFLLYLDSYFPKILFLFKL